MLWSQTQIIFNDSFETVSGNNNITNLDIDIGNTRQTTGTTSTYTASAVGTTTQLANNDDNRSQNNGMMRLRAREPEIGAAPVNGYLSLDNNFGSQLVGKKYSISYDFTYHVRSTTATDQWVSFVLADENTSATPATTDSDFGMLSRPGRVNHPNALQAQFHADGTEKIAYTSLRGYSGSYQKFVFTFDETGSEKKVSLSVGGVLVFSDEIIDFETDNRYLAFGAHIGPDADDINNSTEFADSYIDNLTITIIPEPPTLSFLIGISVFFIVAKRFKS